MEFIYQEKPKGKLKADFDRRRREGKCGYLDFQEFKSWYESADKVCHYCGLREEESQEIVMTGILISNRFPQNGVLGRGQSRGMWLEVDRLAPKEKYSLNNCVLSCYFCNNDKSDVFQGPNYKEFQDDRLSYLRKLLNKDG